MGNQENRQTIDKPKTLLVDCELMGPQNIREYVASHGQDVDNFKLKRVADRELITVIGGGMSAEREVSYMSSHNIVKSLLNQNYQVIFLDMGRDIARAFDHLKPKLVFNGLHGTYGEDGCVPGLLNIMQIPYTGPGVGVSAVALNKYVSYGLFQNNNIKIVDYKTVKKSDNIKTDPMPRPYVIKPISQGSSVGIELVFEEDKFDFAQYDFPYGDEILVEEYIKGKEIQVAVLNGKALGALEIRMINGKRFYDFEAKYTAGFTEHIYPTTISREAEQQVLSIAEKACKICHCQEGLIRVEFLYDEAKQQYYMLELNTHPGFTDVSICPEIASYQGISYDQLVKEVIKKASYER